MSLLELSPPPTWSEAIALTLLGCILLAVVVALVVKLAEARQFREEEELRAQCELEATMLKARQDSQARRDRRQQEFIMRHFDHTTHGN